MTIIDDLSILREAEYKKMANITLDGVILDVGGGNDSAYQKLLQGDHTFYCIDNDPNRNPDTVVDVEKPFPLEDERFDHAVCLNVLEHVYEFEHVVSEIARVMKPGGTLVMATPMLYQIHGSPDDYLRYTDSALRRLFDKSGFAVVSIDPLAPGFFTVGGQILRSAMPGKFFRWLLKRVTVIIDGIFNFIPPYKRIGKRLPLGYISIAKKHV